MYNLAQSIFLLDLLIQSLNSTLNNALIDGNISQEENDLLTNFYSELTEWDKTINSCFPIEIKQLPSNIRKK